MDFEKKPQIIAIGVDEKLIDLIASYLAHKYLFVSINHIFSIEQLDSYNNIMLFLVNTDLTWTNVEELIRKIRSDSKYNNTPFIAFAMKRHIDTMSPDFRMFFEDLILMPCNSEDLLTRIEVWIHTSELVNKKHVKTFECEIDPIQLKGEN